MLEEFTQDKVVDGTTEFVDLRVNGPVANPDMYDVDYFQSPIYVWPYKSYEERILTDNHSSDKWKSCEHFKSACGTAYMTGSRVSSLRYASDDSEVCFGEMRNPYSAYWGEFGANHRLDLGLDAFFVARPDGFIPAPGDLDSLNAMALKTMLPGIKTELSIVNSLYELKDFRSLAKSAANLTRRLYKSRSLWSTIKSPKNSSISRLWKEISKTWDDRKRKFATAVADDRVGRYVLKEASSNFLQWKFAILPLISDIKALMRAMSATEKALNRLISQEGRVQSKHFAWRWSEFNDSESLSDWSSLKDRYNDLWSGVRWGRRVIHNPTTFHAQIEYNYNYTQYQREHARVLAFLDATGLHQSVNIIWNALPWSFVIDWVVGVNRYLDQFTVGALEPRINILRYLWSVKRSRQIFVTRQTRYDTGFASGTVDTNVVSLPPVSQSAYRRTVGLPSSSSISTSGLNIDEFTLAAALVFANAGSKSRRRG